MAPTLDRDVFSRCFSRPRPVSAGESIDLPWRLSGFSLATSACSAKHAKVAPQFAVAKDGQPARLFITATIEPGWYTYSITQKPGAAPRRTSPSGAPDFRLLGPFKFSIRRRRKAGGCSTTRVENHRGTVTWYAPIELAAGVDPAKLKITGKVAMQRATRTRASTKTTR